MSGRVLVVDDMAIVREPIAASLSDTGFEVKQAGNGLEAQQVLRDWVPQVILLDIAMPEMDGLTFLEWLRQDPLTKNLPVILLTAVSDRNAVKKAAMLGVRDYLLKSSFSLKDMVTRVTRYVNQPPGTVITKTEPVGTADHQPEQEVQSTAERQATSVAPQVAPGVKNNPVAAQVSAPAARAAAARPEPRIIGPAKVHATAGIIAAKNPPKEPTPARASSRGETDKFVLLNREQTQSRLSEIASVRTCAGIVAQVTALASSPRTDVSDLVKVIEADPVMTSKILQMANSAAYRSKFNRLSGIEDAVRKIGMRAIQNLAISVGIFDAFPPDAADGFNTMRCWQHSFAVSAVMRTLLASWTEEDRERGALVGICHELGEIVLRQYFAAEYELILAQAEATKQPRHAVEHVALSMRHADLIGEVLTRIGLPSNITLPIMRFHDGGVAGISADDSKIVKTMQFAEWMANGMLLTVSSDSPVGPINRADLRRLCGDAPMPDLHLLRSEVLATTNFLARLPATDEAKFLKPMLPRHDLNIWYARHQSYAEADPFASIFDLLGSVHADTNTPRQAEEVGQYDAFVIASPVPESGPLTTGSIAELQASPSYRGQPIILFCGMHGAPPVGKLHCLQIPTTIQHLSSMVENVVAVKGSVPVQQAE